MAWTLELSGEARKLLFTFAVFWVFLGTCAIFYGVYEGWTVKESFFFAVVTMSSVGYGYRVPSDDHSRLFTVFIMLFGVFFVFASVNDAVSTRLANIRSEYMKRHANATPTELYRVHQWRLFRTFLFIVVFLFIAAGIFCILEGWTFVKALYFAVQTATTIGFGDLDLKRNGTDTVLGIYVMFSTTLIFFAFNNFTTLHQEFRHLKQCAELAERQQTLMKLKELDTGDGVPMDTFVLAVLEQLGKIDRKQDIEPWIAKFRELDQDNNGKIASKEIEQLAQNEATSAARNLAELTAVTGGNRNVALAALHDVSQNLADAWLLNPLLHAVAPSTRKSSQEGDVHMQESGSFRPSASYRSSGMGGTGTRSSAGYRTSDSANQHESLVGNSVSSSAGSYNLGDSVNQLHAHQHEV